MHVPIDRTENDPLTFREVLREFEIPPVPARCIATTDRHTRCKFKAIDGGEFCRRHNPTKKEAR